MKTKTKKVYNPGPGGFVIQGDVIQGDKVRGDKVQGDKIQISFGDKKKPKMEYPAGSIGADLMRRNYIRYLTERYFRFREADASFGRKAVRRFSYAVLFKNIEAHFKAPTYFIHTAHFGDLVDFLHDKIGRTILGKRNSALGYQSYETFDEFQLEQSA